MLTSSMGESNLLDVRADSSAESDSSTWALAMPVLPLVPVTGVTLAPTFGMYRLYLNHSVHQKCDTLLNPSHCPSSWQNITMKIISKRGEKFQPQNKQDGKPERNFQKVTKHHVFVSSLITGRFEPNHEYKLGRQRSNKAFYWCLIFRFSWIKR